MGEKLDWAVEIIRTWETQEAAARGEAEAISRRADAMRQLIIRAMKTVIWLNGESTNG